MKTIILGVGNQILGDDGVGIHVTKELKKHVKDPNITIDDAITVNESIGTDLRIR